LYFVTLKTSSELKKKKNSTYMNLKNYFIFIDLSVTAG